MHKCYDTLTRLIWYETNLSYKYYIKNCMHNILKKDIRSLRNVKPQSKRARSFNNKRSQVWRTHAAHTYTLVLQNKSFWRERKDKSMFKKIKKLQAASVLPFLELVQGGIQNTDILKFAQNLLNYENVSFALTMLQLKNLSAYIKLNRNIFQHANTI